MDLQDYYLTVAQALVSDKYETWRTGQVYFQTLQEIRPDLVELIAAQQGIDPFYDNRNLPAFRDFLTENW